jgi:hypothetical protein
MQPSRASLAPTTPGPDSESPIPTH